MRKIGKVLGTFSADKSSKGLPRPRVESLELIEGFGIKNDKFAGKDLNSTVMIVGQASYELAKENGIDLEEGSYGENLLFDFDPHMLQLGDRLVIGESEMEITEACSICSHLAVFGEELPDLVAHKRGLYCKILLSGFIEKGMEVFIKEGL